MIRQQQIVIDGMHLKPIVLDVSYNKNKTNLPIVIFCHGYKGFKDWGAWNLMATKFAEAGFYFIKFNFSHNGGTISQTIDFPDLEAFGYNNYSKELDDLNSVINWVCNSCTKNNLGDVSNLFLVGHSRGGGIALIKAEEDTRIKKVITLAGVCDFASRMEAMTDLQTWKNEGVTYVVNGRTKQNMPHYYQFFEDFKINEKRLTIKRAVSNLAIPHLIIHGDNDTSVSLTEGKNLYEWNKNSVFKIIKNANHVFGASHPWESKSVPEHLQLAINYILQFLKQ